MPFFSSNCRLFYSGINLFMMGNSSIPFTSMYLSKHKDTLCDTTQTINRLSQWLKYRSRKCFFFKYYCYHHGDNINLLILLWFSTVEKTETTKTVIEIKICLFHLLVFHLLNHAHWKLTKIKLKLVTPFPSDHDPILQVQYWLPS